MLQKLGSEEALSDQPSSVLYCHRKVECSSDYGLQCYRQEDSLAYLTKVMQRRRSWLVAEMRMSKCAPFEGRDAGGDVCATFAVIELQRLVSPSLRRCESEVFRMSTRGTLYSDFGTLNSIVDSKLQCGAITSHGPQTSR